MDCIFCKIVEKKIPSEIVYEDEQIMAFKDADPQAPIHLLIIPKKHIASIMEVDKDDVAVINQIVKVAQLLVRQNNLDKKGFRLVLNTGKEGGQTVNHLHFHLIGGRFMTWPPG